MASIIVVGKNSFLARRFLALTTTTCEAVSHSEIDRPGLFDAATCVINFAIDPRQRTQTYEPERDLDLVLATRIPASARLVTMSSRMVYGPDQARGAAETLTPTGLNAYGKNKLETEARVGDRLGNRVTILRLANILGWDKSGGHPSFILQVLGGLERENRITYDISPFGRKDFTTDAHFVNILDQLCNSPSDGGTYNVGSGIPLEVGYPAMWVIEGRGKGELLVTSPREHDEFWLDVSKATRTFGPPPSRAELRDACLELGRKLARD